jgi:hypothetical protein
MSIRISLENQPEFYTNLDYVRGRIILQLSRPEQVGLIIVKLEGESKTALSLPHNDPERPSMHGGAGAQLSSEVHKVLYKVQQVFPDDDDMGPQSSASNTFVLQAGRHEYPFKFKLPFNNACSDPVAMSKIGGLGGVGGFGSGGGLFGLGGIRVMDGSKQLFLHHVTKTLPPSLTGPREAEIRYFMKVTIQRPGLLKENWRYQIGLKFMPIEPPRPPLNGQEAFAKRPFTFQPRTPQPQRRKSSFFGSKQEVNLAEAEELPPSIEMNARLPHPPILTCNQPVPLRLIATKLVPSSGQIYLVSFQMDLIGTTHMRCHELANKDMNRWVVVAQTGLSIPLTQGPTDEMGTEFVVPDDVWKNVPLPNNITPSFTTCNLMRTYDLELRLGLSWGKPASRPLVGASSSKNLLQPETIYLPILFSKIQVFSGVAPPAALLDAIAHNANRPSAATLEIPPRLPPRTSSSAPVTPTQANRPGQAAGAYDPLYPPQLGAGAVPAPGYDDAPPSYDEAMAEEVPGPFDGLRPRPAYSGVTNENGPSQISEKN